MAKDRYPYPPDEFDLADRSNKPVGAHEQPRSTWSKVWPFLLVLVIVPAVAFGAIKFISDRSSVDPGPNPEQEQTATAPKTPATTAQTEPTTPAPTPTTPSATPTPTYQVDKATQVQVLNASNANGQAAAGAQKLRANGFTNVTSANYQGQNRQGENTVYYTSDEQSETAKVVAETLGFQAVEKNEVEAAGSISAVIRVAIQ